MNSQIDFLKQIIIIMMGLSLTSAVETFITKYFPKNDSFNYLIFFLLLLNIIRFFYASWMYLENVISKSPSETNRKYLANFMIVISQSLIFSFLSFITYDKFFEFFSLILIIDVIGCTCSDKSNIKIFKNPKNQYSLERNWILNNLFSVILLLLIFLIVPDKKLSYQLCLGVSIINTIIGFKLSWKFYYPI
jgi:hypothetical protein